jgi:hypothetical protein
MHVSWPTVSLSAYLYKTLIAVTAYKRSLIHLLGACRGVTHP